MAISVLVLMPFSEKLRDHYELGIKPAVASAGCHCIRADEELILDDIASQVRHLIAETDIMVAEVTDPNPNVYYEVGYAHGIGKDVIFLTREAEGIPFDTRGMHHIIYSSITELRDQLAERLALWKSQMELVRQELLNSIEVGKLREDAQRVIEFLMSRPNNEASALECARQARGIYAVLNDLRFVGFVEFPGSLRAGVRVRLTPAARRTLEAREQGEQ